MFIAELCGEPNVTEFDIKWKDKMLHFKMRETLGLDDERWMTQFTDPQTGKTDWAALIAKRLTTSILQPKLTTADIAAFPKSVLDVLQKRWILLNSLDQASFLERPEEKTSPTQEGRSGS